MVTTVMAGMDNRRNHFLLPMIKTQNNNIGGKLSLRQTLGTLLVLTFAGAVGAADWKLTAGVGASETYTDNVVLGSSGRQGGDFVTSITPTFSAKKDGARLKVDAQYSLQNLFYLQNSSNNAIFQQLNARANVELYGREFFLDTTAAISQAVISPLAATGSDNINATNNIANNRTFSLSPYWTHRFGSMATLNARNTLSYVSNDAPGFSNSTNNTLNVGLASGSDFGRFSWGLNTTRQNVSFQDRPNVTFSTTSASLGYLVSSRIRLTGTVGSENNQFSTTTGSAPGGSFWNATASWAPSPRTSVELGFGDRFFGKTWNLAFKTRGAFYTWSADYNESLNTSNSQFANSGIGATSPQPQARDLFLFNQNVLTNQVFLNKRFATAFALKKGRNDFRLEAFHSSQTTQIDQNINTVILTGTGTQTNNNDIFLLTNDFKQVGFSGAWDWRVSPLITSNATLGFTRNSFAGLNRTDTTSSLQFGINRQFSPQLNGSLSLRHQNRDSNQSTSDFSENAITGSVNYKF